MVWWLAVQSNATSATTLTRQSTWRWRDSDMSGFRNNNNMVEKFNNGGVGGGGGGPVYREPWQKHTRNISAISAISGTMLEWRLQNFKIKFSPFCSLPLYCMHAFGNLSLFVKKGILPFPIAIWSSCKYGPQTYLAPTRNRSRGVRARRSDACWCATARSSGTASSRRWLRYPQIVVNNRSSHNWLLDC